MTDKQCSAAEVARAAGVKEASIAGWKNGDTKSLKADPALKAAHFLGVSPYWLVLGKGPKNASEIERHMTNLAMAQAQGNVSSIQNYQLTADEKNILDAFRRADKQTKAFLIDSAVALLNRLDGFGSGIETQPGHDAKKLG